MNNRKKERGITLIALAVTIIVMLILAGVTIASLISENGIIKQAQQVKTKNEISKEKEDISRAITASLLKNGDGKIELNDLQDELNKENGEGKTEVADGGDMYEILFKETNRLYTIDKEDNTISQQEISKDPNPGDITKDKDGNELTGNSEADAYEISSIEDLVQFSKMTNEGNNFEGKYIKLTRNLNFNSSFSYSDPENTTIFGDYNNDNIEEGIKSELTKEGARGFIPIKQFYGTFLGQNNRISNIKIQETLDRDNRYLGFIKENTGTIEDLKLSGKIIVDMAEGNRAMYYIGGVCGANEGIVKNAENYIELNLNLQTASGGFFAGGIAGKTEGDSDANIMSIIDNCANKADFSATGKGDYRIGGIAGYVDTAQISNCKNEGYIKSESTDYSCIGGIVCNVYDAIVDRCYNVGKLETISNNRIYLGGISAMDYNLKITNSYNAGEIIANGYAARMGGISGSSENGTTIENCYNIGTIRTTSNSTVIRVGGLVGFTFDRSNEELLTVKNSYNAGKMDIQGQATQKGTLYGLFFGTIQNCYALQTEGIELAGNTSDKITQTDCATKTSDEMKKVDFVNLLNNEAFKKDSSNINNGYPILNWQ